VGFEKVHGEENKFNKKHKHQELAKDFDQNSRL
jgi:hypothetical protein